MAPKMLRDCNVEDFAVIVKDVTKYNTTVNKVMYKFTPLSSSPKTMLTHLFDNLVSAKGIVVETGQN